MGSCCCCCSRQNQQSPALYRGRSIAGIMQRAINRGSQSSFSVESQSSEASQTSAEMAAERAEYERLHDDGEDTDKQGSVTNSPEKPRPGF